jgi:hypothetical protein
MADGNAHVRSGTTDDRSARTLDELDPPAWPDAPVDATPLVRRVHALRTVPVGRLSVEDLRLLLGQDVGRPVLVPIALRVLRERPLAEGDLYPGDLLMAVLRVPEDHWAARPDEKAALRAVVASLDPSDPEHPRDDPEFEAAVARAGS